MDAEGGGRPDIVYKKNPNTKVIITRKWKNYESSSSLINAQGTILQT
jgi:hypothetical protein